MLSALLLALSGSALSCSAVAATDPDPARGTPAAGSAAIQEVVYDLVSARVTGQVSHEGTEVLLPALWSHGETYFPGPSETAGTGEVEAVLWELHPDELQAEGVAATWVDDTRWLLRAPAAVHQLVQKDLAVLESTFGAVLELGLDVVELPPGAALAAGLVSAAEAERVVSEARAAGRAQSHVLRVRAGETAVVDSTRQIALVGEYDVEIAQSATIHDPVTILASVGTRVQVRAARSDGGHWLAIVLRAAEAAGPLRELELDYDSLISGDREVTTQRAPRVLQDLPLLDHSLCWNAWLPDGKALVARWELDVTGAQGSRAIVVRVLGGGLPSVKRLSDAGSTERSVWAIGGESFAPPRAVFESFWLDVGERQIVMELYGERQALGWLESSDASWVETALLAGDEPPNLMWFGPWMVASYLPGGGSGDSTAGAFPTDVQGRLAPLAPAERLVVVEGILRRGERQLARIGLPLRIGEAGLAVLGCEERGVWEYDVEVAAGAAMADPRVRTTLDGMVIEFLPRAASGGGIELGLRGRATIASARREFSPQSGLVGAIHQQDADELIVDERLVFPKGDGKARRVVLGDSGGGADALSLEISLAEPR